MEGQRCPYHVKQGFVNEFGQLAVSDVCGVKTAAGAKCSQAPFTDCSFQECPRYICQQKGGERQVLLPKNDLEYLPEVAGNGSFSELELM
jgi:hypothetical protein